jgi:hypothetical protein
MFKIDSSNFFSVVTYSTTSLTDRRHLSTFVSQSLTGILESRGAGLVQSVQCQTTDWTTGVQSPARQRIFPPGSSPDQL